MLVEDEVAAAVGRLDLDHRIVIVLRFWQDLALEGVADRLDLPLGTVKSRLHYALKALRKELRRPSDEA
jgi:RNA polymerase sigma-70 factor (ECF subfamily)